MKTMRQKRRGGDNKCKSMEKEELEKMSDSEIASVHRNCCKNPFSESFRSDKCKTLKMEMHRRWQDNVSSNLEYYDERNKDIKSCRPLDTIDYDISKYESRELEKLNDNCCGPFARRLKNRESTCTRLDARIFKMSQKEFENNLGKVETYILKQTTRHGNDETVAGNEIENKLVDEINSLKTIVSNLESKIQNTQSSSVVLDEIRKINENIAALQKLPPAIQSVSKSEAPVVNKLLEKTLTPIAEQIQQVANVANSSVEEVVESNKFAKFDKMKKTGLPEGAIRQKMMAEGFSDEEINNYFSSNSKSPLVSSDSASLSTLPPPPPVSSASVSASLLDSISEKTYVSRKKQSQAQNPTFQKKREDPTDEELDKFTDMFDNLKNYRHTEGENLGKPLTLEERFAKVKFEASNIFTPKTWDSKIRPYVNKYRTMTTEEKKDFENAEMRKGMGNMLGELTGKLKRIDGGKQSKRKKKKNLHKTNRSRK